MAIKLDDTFGLKGLLQQLPVTIFWKDLNSIYLGCSEQMAKLAGFGSLEEVIGKSDYEMAWADVAQALISNDRDVIQTGETKIFPENLCFEQGDLEVSFTIKTPLRDEQDNIIGVLGVSNFLTNMSDFLGVPVKDLKAKNIVDRIETTYLQKLYQDISGRKLSSNLDPAVCGKKVRDYVENLISLLPVQVFWMDCKGVYLGVNDAVVYASGRKAKHEIVGKSIESFSDRQPEELIKKIREQNDRVVRTGEPTTVEHIGFNEKNEKACYLVHKTPIRDPDTKEVIGVLGTGIDITDRKRMEEELKQAKEQTERVYQAESDYLRNLYQSISGQTLPKGATAEKTAQKIWHYIENVLYQVPVCLFWLDKNGRYLGCNQACADVGKLFGVSDIIGKTNEELFPPAVANEIDKNNKKVMDSGEMICFEECLEPIEGQQSFFLSHKAPIQDNETGEVIGLIGAALDITERKLMEQELAKAKEQSEAASFAKSHFLNNMRHDIRTPLSCIVGSARILEKMEDDPEKLEFIEGILDCSENLLEMVTGMLEYDTVSAKERAIKLEVVKMKKLARDLFLMVSMAAKRKGIDLQLNIADDVPERIVIDSYRMQRILLNLVSNAIKFTNEGYVALNMAISRQDMKTLALNIAVHDTGIGIPQDKHERIFSKFVRLATKEKDVKGEGLGLSIVKQYVTELGGSIEVSSSPGEGSTFYLTVPCRVAVTQKEDAL